MPATRKKSLEDLMDSQTNLSIEHKHLEDGLQQLNEKMDRIIQLISNQQDKKEIQFEEIINQLKAQQEYLEYFRRPYIQNEVLKTKKRNLQNWNIFLKQRKMAFYHAVKCSDTAATYKTFLTMEDQFIPYKFREKITPQDTEEQVKIKKALSISKLQAEIDIREDKKVHSTEKYTEIDNKVFKKIKELCPKETHQPLLELWDSECKKEEEKSREIIGRKITWLKNLPEKEKSKQSTNTYKDNQEQNTLTRYPQTQRSHNKGKKRNIHHTQTHPHNRYNYTQRSNHNIFTSYTNSQQLAQPKRTLITPQNYTRTRTINEHNTPDNIPHNTSPQKYPLIYNPKQYKPNYYHPIQRTQSKVHSHRHYIANTNNEKIPLLNNPYQNTPTMQHNFLRHRIIQNTTYNSHPSYPTQRNKPLRHLPHQREQSEYPMQHQSQQTDLPYNKPRQHNPIQQCMYPQQQHQFQLKHNYPTQKTYNDNPFNHLSLNPHNIVHNTHFTRRHHITLKHTTPRNKETNNSQHFLGSPQGTTIPG